MSSRTPPTIEGRPSPLLAQWTLSADDAATLGVTSAREFSIYGVKVPVPLYGPEAWRSEYAVHEHRADGERLQHRLAQRERHRSTMWIAAEATNEDAMADMVAPSAIACLSAKPRWKRDAGAIPVRADGGLYVFLKQFYVPNRADIRAHFQVGFSLFLFATRQAGDALELALFEQDMSEQTAEDHYRLEQQIAGFLAAPRDLAGVEALIRAGDAHFHAFVLESPRSTLPVLETLLKHARTQTLKKAVQKRIAGFAS
ncbi:hypothetical protein PRJ39_04900 [Lysobacter enzymogenes]|uniref:hypothetical protein n=1 Tax=Lysobacter enzymogenes TaxID=69 RepID=UPI00374A5031